MNLTIRIPETHSQAIVDAFAETYFCPQEDDKTEFFLGKVASFIEEVSRSYIVNQQVQVEKTRIEQETTLNVEVRLV